MINNENIFGSTNSKPLTVIGKYPKDSLSIEFSEQKHTAGVSD